MQKHILLALFLIYLFPALGQGFDVDNYSVDIYLNKAGFADVVENYNLDFTKSKYGISRKIYPNYNTKEDSQTEISKKNIRLLLLNINHQKVSIQQWLVCS